MSITPEQDRQDAVVEVLIQLQQGLLAEGYVYTDGDPESWPASPVLLAKGNRYVLAAAWPVHMALLRDFWDNLRRNAKAAGLILVGETDPQDPVLDHLFEAAAGTLVYVQARTGALRVRRAIAGMPEVLSETALPRLFGPSDFTTRSLDCHAILVQHLAHRREQAAAEAWMARPPGTPAVTVTLIGLCALIFLAMMHAVGMAGDDPGAVQRVYLQWGALVPSLVQAGEWWRLLTSGFLHGGVMHILFNMVALYNLGYVLEHWQGRARFAALFLASVVAGSLFVVWFQRETGVTLGASGGVFGLLGGFVAIAARYGRDFSPEVRERVFGWIPRVLILNGIISFLPGISLFGHLGGLVGGFLVGLVILKSPARR